MIGTGSLLTAAHCVFERDTNSWQKDWVYAPAQYSGGSNPYGTYGWSHVTTFTGYTNPYNSNPWPYDLAVIQLSGTGTTLGSRTGWLGMEWSSTFNGVLNTAGYPGDKPWGTYWWTSCSVQDNNGADGQIKNYCDIYGGQSGSPMFVYRGGSSYNVRGAVSYQVTSNNVPLYNMACEVTSSNMNTLLSWR
jgi:V8-like Glu-specific endopeptidase